MDTELHQLWQTCLREIESQVTRANFSTWFKNTAILREEEGVLVIGVPNEFVKEWLFNKYHKLILKTIVDQAQHVRAIEFAISKLESRQEQKPISEEKSSLPFQDLYINKEDNLNPKYTFDRFIVGSFNELAFAAAQAVISRPSQAYNPLFIYGSSGLGKTHLIQAIGNEIKAKFPEKKVLYTTLEKFANDYISAVQNNRATSFREKYRKFDFLIMDDIQFLSTKEKTQEELFHLFNTLYDQNKNIVFSSDKHPNHILGIEDRLKTRFSAGMTIDIQEPDFESRLAILREKTSSMNLALSEDIITYLATSITGSIRELEGVLNVLSCQVQLKQKEISLDEVRQLIKYSVKPKKNVLVQDIVRIISNYYNVDEKIIYEKTRRKEIVRARQMIMFILREDFNASYPTIGAKLGGKDHTTVIHSYEKIKRDLLTNPLLMRELEDIRVLFK